MALNILWTALISAQMTPPPACNRFQLCLQEDMYRADRFIESIADVGCVSITVGSLYELHFGGAIFDCP